MCLNESDVNAAAFKSQYLSTEAERITAAVFAFLSAGGSAFIVVTYLAISDLRRATVRQLLLSLSVATMVGSAANATGALRYFTTVECEIQALFTVISSLSCIFWTTSIALYLYISIVLRRPAAARTHVWVFHVVNWLVPLAVGLIAYFEDALGPTYSRTTVGWCWVSLQPATPSDWKCSQRRIFWALFALKAWEVLSYVAVPIIYYLIKRFLDEEVKDEVNSDGLPENLKRAVRNIDVKLKIIPVLFILLRVWGTVRVFLDITDSYKHVSATSYKTLLYFQAIGDNSQGIVHFILFTCLTESIRKRFAGCFDGLLSHCRNYTVISTSMSSDNVSEQTSGRVEGVSIRSRSATRTSEMSVFHVSQGSLELNQSQTPNSGLDVATGISPRQPSSAPTVQGSFSTVPSADGSPGAPAFNTDYKDADSVLNNGDSNSSLPHRCRSPPPGEGAVNRHGDNGTFGESSSAPASGGSLDLSASLLSVKRHAELERSLEIAGDLI